MKSYHEETLAALFDGEVGDPDALADALAQPEAREFLVGLSRLRALTQDDDRRPDDHFYAAMAYVIRPNRWRAFLRLPIPLPAAAAAVTAAVAVTFAWFLPIVGTPPPAAPPPPVAGLDGWRQVDGLLPGILGRSAISRPPRADRVLQFVDGRDWRQGS